MDQKDAKSVLLERLVKLTDPLTDIGPSDEFWSVFWTHPHSVNDVFTAFSPAHIVLLRDTNLRNFCLLIRVVATKLVRLTNKASSSGFNPQELLNCVRVLTKLLPYLYERPELARAEKTLFWSLNHSIDPNTANSEVSNGSITATVGFDSLESPNLSTADSTTGVVDAVVSRDKLMDALSLKPTVDESSHSSLPLGAILVFRAVDLLFTTGFTVPKTNKQSSAMSVEFSIWEPGIGLSGSLKRPNVQIDSNRLEILRFLLVLCSQCLYKPVSTVVPLGSRYLTVLVTSVPKLQMLTLISSLLNLICRSTKDPNEYDTGLESEIPAHQEVRTLMVTCALQLFTQMIIYPLPKSDKEFLTKQGILIDTPTNLVRYYCGRLHKEQELEFLEDGLIKPLFRPLETDISSASNMSGLSFLMKNKFMSSNNDLSAWMTEIIMLIWEFYQCNKRFRSYLSTNYGVKLLVALFFQIFHYKNSAQHRNYVRTCSYLFLFLSYDTIIMTQLVTPFDKNFHAALPQNFRLTGSPTTYRDFLVFQTCTLLQSDCPLVLVPTMIEWVYNMIPLVATPAGGVPTTNRRPSMKDLTAVQQSTLQMSYSTCTVLTHLIAKFSSISFLNETNVNLDLLALLMRGLCHLICRHPNGCAIWLYVLLKNKTVYENVLSSIRTISKTDEEEPQQQQQQQDAQTRSSSPTLNPETAEDDPLYQAPEDGDLIRPKLPVGMSFKAKAKLPLNAPLELTWTGLKSTTIILEVIHHLEAKVTMTNSDASAIINQINNAGVAQLLTTLKIPNEYNPIKTKFEPLRFTWSNLSLGWYTSVLWGTIYNQLEVCRAKSMFDVSTFRKVGAEWGFGTWTTLGGKATASEVQCLSPIGIWNGTDVKLLTIKGSIRDVSLSASRPTVDATTDSFIKRFGSLALNRRKSSAASIQTLGSYTQQAAGNGAESPSRPLLSRSMGSVDPVESTPPLVSYSPVPPPSAGDFEGFNLNSFGPNAGRLTSSLGDHCESVVVDDRLAAVVMIVVVVVVFDVHHVFIFVVVVVSALVTWEFDFLDAVGFAVLLLLQVLLVHRLHTIECSSKTVLVNLDHGRCDVNCAVILDKNVELVLHGVEQRLVDQDDVDFLVLLEQVYHDRADPVSFLSRLGSTPVIVHGGGQDVPSVHQHRDTELEVGLFLFVGQFERLLPFQSAQVSGVF
ncbi:hypothetical protein OGAPHI_006957 [Ogataea philodendri]|uniref:Protein HID1 n=1 Tax=Ogataea philodendri TaxID=1378263 RepID=A0A9P8NW93_9ASCO|nr:uncharacterized protein OGAPHI_006957 [Ogataea philodendri]KAH3660371.1 hypothetical protein OGAPHI_006957 [Ogataea philodendri]